MTAPLPATVLYVDDDEFSRRAVHLILGGAGFRVKEAATGRDALRLAGEKPDLVLLDVNLPDISGFEVCRQIKGHAATQAIPVLHLSARYVTTEDRTHGLEGGADGYLTKPVEAKELIAHVRAMLRIRQAEEETRAAARQWQATFDAISDGVALLDRAGLVRRGNGALERLARRPVADLIGRHCTELLPAPADPWEVSAFERMLASGRRETRELPSGDRWLQVTVDPMRDDTGALVGAVFLLADVTEPKRLEDQLRQAQKMQAVGQLAGGVAHDFNNLLTAILGNVALLLEDAPVLGPRVNLLKTIERAGGRAADLVRQLLSFSRQNVLALAPLHLQAAVEETVAMLRCAIDPRVRVKVRGDADLWAVHADPTQVNQVLMNLCLNARDAMPDGGLLLLQTRNVELDAGSARRHIEARAGQFVRLRVRDTGCGIPPHVLPRIFEPFFTTKEPGRGTGLGLATVFGIVKQHGGWIECTSTVNRGTTFDIYFPRSPLSPDAAPAAVAPAPSAAPSGGATILLVDDEPMVRDLGCTILRRAGYRVITAEDGLEALALLRQKRHRIGLVILDLTMPRLSGKDTLRNLRAIDPGIRVLIASGYSKEDPDASGMEGASGFIAKPYRQAELLHLVRTALEGREVR